MHPIPECGPELPLEQQEAIHENQRWWRIGSLATNGDHDIALCTDGNL